MARILPNVFSLLVAVAGWFYLFYSRAAHRLSGVEAAEVNALRVRLRRVGGFVMLLLAVGFFAGFNTVDSHDTPQSFVFVWLCVLVLLAVMVCLALADVRLTWKLRHRREGRP